MITYARHRVYEVESKRCTHTDTRTHNTSHNSARSHARVVRYLLVMDLGLREFVLEPHELAVGIGRRVRRARTERAVTYHNAIGQCSTLSQGCARMHE
jgi:hypothetical protein